MRLKLIVLLFLPLLVSPKAHGAAGEEHEDEPAVSIGKIENVLDQCAWGNPEKSREFLQPTVYRVVEVTVVHKGKALLLESHDGEITGDVSVAEGDPYAFVASLLENASDIKAPDACASIPVKRWQITAEDAQAFAALLERLDRLESVFSLEEEIRFHAPEVKIKIQGSNFSYSAGWFGCDPSSLGRWANELLRQASGELDVCESSLRQ